jgi:hypothetical protein
MIEAQRKAERQLERLLGNLPGMAYRYGNELVRRT